MKKETIIGIISTTRKGMGFVDLPPLPGKKIIKGNSIFIEEGQLNCALNGDTVEIIVEEKSSFAISSAKATEVKKATEGKEEKVGKVTKVISRARENFVGIVEQLGSQMVVVPDDKKIYVNFSLLPEQAEKVTKDDKVYLKMSAWTDPKVLPQANIIRVLGKKGVNNVEMEAIVLERGFEIGFPVAVQKEADEIEKNEKVISKEEIASRRDIRGIPTFTIDPYDAKDFDDAISIREVTNETSSEGGMTKFSQREASVENFVMEPDTRGDKKLYEIGIHIADVSHYVREGSALDKEAVKRGCSIYLVDRTIPMLPEVLSNDVCSLNPNEDKLSFSAIFIIDEKGNIHDRWFGRTVMNSTHRFTYETAQAVIDGEPKNVEKYSKNIQNTASVDVAMKYRDQLVVLNNIAKIMQTDKFSRGAIEFEQEEIKFRLDSDGKPIGVYIYERLDTHKLVEEYMLLANREVAKFIYDSIKKKGKRDTGAIYRIHALPDKDKIKNLATFVKALGYDLHTTDGVVTARDLNQLLKQVEGTPHESLIRTAAVRSMQKAVYSTQNVGHFGLAFEFYTHFTSPIRRYPDLLVHRVLAQHLAHKPFKDTDIIKFQTIADSSTAREINASSAERDSKKLKQVEYMSTRIGQVFQGVISGVSKWGIYVEEKETRSEGMIGLRSLGSDFYVFDEKNYALVGQKSNKRFTLGDPIKFKVMSADIDKKNLDYAVV